MAGKEAVLSVATIMGPRLTAPLRWTDVKSPWSKSKAIQEMSVLFPGFHSVTFTHYSLDKYELLYKAFAEGDRLKLFQSVTLPYYEKLKSGLIAKKCELKLHPKATSGKLLGGFIATAEETKLKFAMISLELTVKSQAGTSHKQSVVMERRSDPQLLDDWKISEIADSNK